MSEQQSMPTDAKLRKESPMAEGLLWYFPAALAAIAHVSKIGNDQHNPGQPMHHARGKSTDHADCILRHLVDAGTKDSDGIRHSAKIAWRALALLQEELEKQEGYPLPRNAKYPSTRQMLNDLLNDATRTVSRDPIDKSVDAPKVSRDAYEKAMKGYPDPQPMFVVNWGQDHANETLVEEDKPAKAPGFAANYYFPYDDRCRCDMCNEVRAWL